MTGSKPPVNAEQRAAEISRRQTEISNTDERLAICGDAVRSGNELRRLAEEGDELPILLLITILVKGIWTLNSIVERRPELGRQLGRASFSWPALISRKRSVRQANEELMAKLQLGKGGIFSGREWQLSARCTQAAIKLWITGQYKLKKPMPPFTKASKKRYFEHLWDEMLKDGIKPEESDLLRPLGKVKFKKKPKYCKNLHPATQVANARAEIKDRVWKAFDTVFRS